LFGNLEAPVSHLRRLRGDRFARVGRTASGRTAAAVKIPQRRAVARGNLADRKLRA